MSFSKIFYGGGGIVFVDSGLPYPGVIYAITPDGSLLWYQDENRQGQNGPNAEQFWAPGSGSQIGFGWQNFTHVFSDGDGIIYAITPEGNLLWYQDENRQGQNGAHADRYWASGSGTPIGSGWQNFTHVFASGSGRDGGGVIYAVTTDGQLLWYRDDNRQGQNGPHGETGWAPGSGTPIGSGWQNFSHIFTGGSEPGGGVIIYAVTSDNIDIFTGRRLGGRLLWYRDDNGQGQNGPHGETGWAPGSGNQIGKGW